MDKTFEEALNNIDNIKVMNKVCTKYFAALSADDLYSLKLTTLWKCLNKYDPSKKTKFTTFLYQQLDLLQKFSIEI